MQDSEPIEQKALSRSENKFANLKKYFVTPKLFFEFMLLIVLLLFIIVTAVTFILMRRYAQFWQRLNMKSIVNYRGLIMQTFNLKIQRRISKQVKFI